MKTKKLLVTPELLFTMFRENQQIVLYNKGAPVKAEIKSGVPESATLLDADMDEDGLFVLLVEDESFPDSVEGKIPLLETEIQTKLC